MGRATTSGRFLSGLTWIVGFGLAGGGLVWLGRYPFLLIDWADPLVWLVSTDPETAAGALARAGGLALVAWVAATTVIYISARLLGADQASIDWLSVGPIRKLVDALLAGSLLATTLTPMSAVAAPAMAATETTQAATDSTTSAVAPGYVPIPAGSSQPPADPVPDTTGAESPVLEPVAVDQAAVIVTPGDNLWKLAEQRLETALGRRPSDADIAPYWVQVIEANRDRLRSGDPDLIYPGEEIILPSFNPRS